MVERCKSKIPPITKYMIVIHLSNISVMWLIIRGSINSFTSVKKRRTLQPTTPDHHSLPTKEVLSPMKSILVPVITQSCLLTNSD